MPKKTNQQQPRKRRSLSVFLNDVVQRAKQNEHSGEARSRDLENELTEIAKRIDETLAEINKEAEADTLPESSGKVAAKLERTTKLLTSELMRLSAVYHRQIDTARIRKFLNQQQEIIRTSMDDGEDASLSLDDRVTELHSLMAAERGRVSRAERRERTKFLVSLSVALVSLGISAYALWLR